MATQTKELIREIEALDREQCLYLNGVGWLEMKLYFAYDGPNPRTGERVNVPARYRLEFRTDTDLSREINGLPHVDKRFETELARYFDNIHGDDPSFDLSEEDPRISVKRFEWADALAADIRHQLTMTGRADVSDVGIFETEIATSGYKRVHFTPAEHLQQQVSRKPTSQ